MFTLIQVTAVRAVLHLAGYEDELRYLRHDHGVALLMAQEPLLEIRRRTGDDLEHALTEILGCWVTISAVHDDQGDPFDLTILERPQIVPAPRAWSASDAKSADTDAGTHVYALSFEEGFRAAYFITEQYIALESDPDEGLVLSQQYLDSDPARWSDWQKAVTRALADPTAASEYLHDFRLRFAAPDEQAGTPESS